MKGKGDKSIPNLGNAFKGLKKSRTKQGKSKEALKAELQSLEAGRRKSELKLDYTIGGYKEKIVHQELDGIRERKIMYHQTCIGLAPRKTKSLFSKKGFARFKGKAARDFNKSR